MSNYDLLFFGIGVLVGAPLGSWVCMKVIEWFENK